MWILAEFVFSYRILYKVFSIPLYGTCMVVYHHASFDGALKPACKLLILFLVL